MPVTQFSVPEKYDYNIGLGSYHHSEALNGTNPVGQNSPQVPPFKLLTEVVSGTSFTTPRNLNLSVWMYRVTASRDRGKYEPYNVHGASSNATTELLTYSPNFLHWNDFELKPGHDWVASQKVFLSSGDIPTKTGFSYSVFAATEDMAPNTAYYSSDGDTLIIPQSGVLDIKTELGCLLVRPNEIAMIPRGLKYRVKLPAGTARGYICELYQGHFQLPELGTVGTAGLANARDFQVPVAIFDGTVTDGVATCSTVQWTIIRKYNGSLFSCTRDHTPFDVAAWHGSYYPYKYDLGRFSVLGSLLYDHPDPSIFTVLTAPSFREPGTAVVEFCIFPPRWQVMEDTYWLPPYHINTMSEFIGFIMKDPEPNPDTVFKPIGGEFTGGMTPHGSNKKEHEAERAKEFKPTKVATEPIMAFLLESASVPGTTAWASKLVIEK